MINYFNYSDREVVLSLAPTGDFGVDNSSLLLEEAPTLTTSASIKAAVLSVMAAASLVGNMATLISIAVNKKGTNSSLYTLLFQVKT